MSVNAENTDAAAELKQAHDDLDVLNVPRDEHGLPLSVPGRILLMARRAKLVTPDNG